MTNESMNKHLTFNDPISPGDCSVTNELVVNELNDVLSEKIVKFPIIVVTDKMGVRREFHLMQVRKISLALTHCCDMTLALNIRPLE